MTALLNQFDQPIGSPLEDWQPCPSHPRTSMIGRTCRVEPLAPDHGRDLYDAFDEPNSERLWTYLPYGPFDTVDDYRDWFHAQCVSQDPLFYAVVDSRSNKPVGVASYLRIEPAIGSIEVGHINYAYALQKTTAATEAMYLLMHRAFDGLGYRRYEWKCDALNADSRAAAERLGFTFEGVFHQHTMYKGRNRDTAWFSITDREWPQVKAAFEAWLDPDNFDGDGRQKQSLESFRA